ncbi:hypothetical protein ABW19_dt0202738 [Dactylella cylindrospora]|nr:hypothetical protein ABW19_dt0202738 [Dactylella cylindrospora]
MYMKDVSDTMQLKLKLAPLLLRRPCSVLFRAFFNHTRFRMGPSSDVSQTVIYKCIYIGMSSFPRPIGFCQTRTIEMHRDLYFRVSEDTASLSKLLLRLSKLQWSLSYI